MLEFFAGAARAGRVARRSGPGRAGAGRLPAAARWGVSGDWMVSMARCESGLRPNAYNPRGPYYGLFQFLMSTFRANGGTNIWDAADQANIAAPFGNFTNVSRAWPRCWPARVSGAEIGWPSCSRTNPSISS